MKRSFIYAVIIASVLVFSGCGGGGSDSTATTSETEQTGVFLDSAVEGVKYKTTSGLEGYTNNKGEYKFNIGDNVEFLVGDISLGNIKAQEIISVLELEDATQTAQLLQSLDTDGNPNNGINISKETFKLFENSTIDIKEVNINHEEFNSKFENITGKKFKINPQDAISHAKYSMMIENLKSMNSNLYGYYMGTSKIFDRTDIRRDKTNKKKMIAFSNRRLLLYYFDFFIAPELQFDRKYQFTNLSNQEEAYEATKKFIEGTTLVVGEISALINMDPTEKLNHAGKRALNYGKGQALKYIGTIREDRFVSNQSLLSASQIALHKAMLMADSCKGVYIAKDPVDKFASIAGCATALASEGANIFNDGYMAYNFYTTAKQSNTALLAEAYLSEYFNSAGDINFMHARYSASGRDDFIEKLIASTLTRSTVYWSDDYSVDMELFEELVKKYMLMAQEKVKIMKDTYGLKSNLDALSASVLTTEITRSNYSVDDDKFNVCYRVINESNFNVGFIKLSIKIEDDQTTLASKDMQIKDMWKPSTTEEQCVSFNSNIDIDLDKSKFVNITSNLEYIVDAKRYNFKQINTLYFNEMNIFDMLKKIAPPTIVLETASSSVKDLDVFLVTAYESYVDSSQGTLSFEWKQINGDGYDVDISSANNHSPTIFISKLPEGVNKKVIWIEVKAIASISKKESIKTFKVTVSSLAEANIELPKADAGKNIIVNIGETITFNGKNSNEEYLGFDEDIDWNWYLGTQHISNKKIFEYKFEDAGVFKFKLEVNKPRLYDLISDDIVVINVMDKINYEDVKIDTNADIVAKLQVFDSNNKLIDIPTGILVYYVACKKSQGFDSYSSSDMLDGEIQIDGHFSIDNIDKTNECDNKVQFWIDTDDNGHFWEEDGDINVGSFYIDDNWDIVSLSSDIKITSLKMPIEYNEAGVLVTDLVSGHIDFEENNSSVSTPLNAWVRIVPKEYQTANNWNGPKCKIDSSGNFGNECYVHHDLEEVRAAFNNNSEFQVAIYKESTDNHHWDPEEDIYFHYGESISKNGWNKFTAFIDNNQDNGSNNENNNSEIFTDTSTGLMWQDNEEAKTVGKSWLTEENYDNGNLYDTSGDTAKTYCENFSFSGYSDWRLPTFSELKELYKKKSSLNNNAVDADDEEDDYYYWSSNNYVDGAGAVDFYNGDADTLYKFDTAFVRCVRAGQ